MPKYRVTLKTTPRQPTRVVAESFDAESESAAKLAAYKEAVSNDDDAIVKIVDCQPVKVWRVEGRLYKPVEYTLFLEGVDENEVAKRLRDEFVTWDDVLRYAEASGGEVYHDDSYDDRAHQEAIYPATPEEIKDAVRDLSTDPYDY
jgi:hypothetical protein